MSEQWNQRYRHATALPAANPLLALWQHLIPSCQPSPNQQPTIPLRALDVACGLGQNAFYLATKGFVVEAWDSSSVAIEQVRGYAQQHGLAVRGRQVDFVQDDLAKLSQAVASDLDGTEQCAFEMFDFVIVNAYLQRDLCPQIMRWLKPNGVLFYQTFNQVQAGKKPSNPDFLLRPGELLDLFAPLLPLVYWDDQQDINLRCQNDHNNQHHNLGKALLIAKKTTAGA